VLFCPFVKDGIEGKVGDRINRDPSPPFYDRNRQEHVGGEVIRKAVKIGLVDLTEGRG